MALENEKCKGCGKVIKEGEDIIGVLSGKIEYLEYNGKLLALLQDSTPLGFWHKGCFPEDKVGLS